MSLKPEAKTNSQAKSTNIIIDFIWVMSLLPQTRERKPKVVLSCLDEEP